jgi:hypothetical protein
MPLTDEEHELMDLYVTAIPGGVFRGGVHTTYLFNPVRDFVFRESLTSPFLFQMCVIAFAAGYKARWFGFKETEQSRKHKVKALRLVHEAARHAAGTPTDALILGITGLAHWEDRWGSVESSYKQIAFAQQLVKKRADMNSPRPRPYCESWLHLIHYTMGPKPKPVHNNDPQAGPLIRCLGDFHSLMLVHREMSTKFPSLKRFTAFEPGTALYGQLSINDEVKLDFPDKYFYTVLCRMNIILRMASLLNVHLALWDHRESMNDVEEYLNVLELSVKQHELDRYPSTADLLWVMLNAEDHPRLGNPARAFIVGDILNEAKSLEIDQQEQLNDFLVALLLRKDPPSSLSFWENVLAAT